MSEWSPDVLEVLEASGWTAGRRVDTAGWRSRFETVGLVMHDAAEKFLQEFGGLSVNHGGPGINRAREPFELDPGLAWAEGDRFSEWSDFLGRRFFPLGELDHGRFFLLNKRPPSTRRPRTEEPPDSQVQDHQTSPTDAAIEAPPWSSRTAARRARTISQVGGAV
ncbi:SUKH-3 domain-containing protein [Streptomyces sp. NPDC058295]|uniref:SUKH-3 domain-containing protein n=1 Tax=Streptomyces sp. NPDC058295 TaxID=3346431 RepID=UPI0036F00B86